MSYIRIIIMIIIIIIILISIPLTKIIKVNCLVTVSFIYEMDFVICEFLTNDKNKYFDDVLRNVDSKDYLKTVSLRSLLWFPQELGCLEVPLSRHAPVLLCLLIGRDLNTCVERWTDVLEFVRTTSHDYSHTRLWERCTKKKKNSTTF